MALISTSLYNWPASPVTITVPTGAYIMTVECYSSGTAGYTTAGGGQGGLGGNYSTATINVTPGDSYTGNIGLVVASSTTSEVTVVYETANPSNFVCQAGRREIPNNPAEYPTNLYGCLGDVFYHGGNGGIGLGGGGGGAAGPTGNGGNGSPGPGGNGGTKNGGYGANGAKGSTSTVTASTAGTAGGGGGGYNTSHQQSNGGGGYLVVSFYTIQGKGRNIAGGASYNHPLFY